MTAPTRLYTDAELADLLRIPLPRLQAMRKREDWPHLKVGRSYRYTPNQVGEIIRHLTHGRVRIPGRIPGQTDLSAARSQR